jgi:hypothetical protein
VALATKRLLSFSGGFRRQGIGLGHSSVFHLLFESLDTPRRVKHVSFAKFCYSSMSSFNVTMAPAPCPLELECFVSPPNSNMMTSNQDRELAAQPNRLGLLVRTSHRVFVRLAPAKRRRDIFWAYSSQMDCVKPLSRPGLLDGLAKFMSPRGCMFFFLMLSMDGHHSVNSVSPPLWTVVLLDGWYKGCLPPT